ncbi:bifunctional diaminohydroxyphosphoribosylaminopyrimidine deaminase/5-amino-6-(5-phosphoribosylamino)uracil reductase RibD [Candidatus Gracilibacteria bacterium]|nr:bifunctional diaminohydroxyphosphoribosylaminopyrimidine deaminase/5-amino-6-(5-phosphoribosylamino)uracil reductase RibD [Candidatus Gracilibacteria bacterium]
MNSSSYNFLDYARKLAGKINPHFTAPNPRVGCVIVQKGKILAKGVHEKYGNPHAEAMAIENLIKAFPQKNDFSDCEIFITLEPCDQFAEKNTPSCTELLLKKNFGKIWIGSLDPHFQGKNIKKLQAHGQTVEVLNNSKCQELNPFFETFIVNKKPFITLKIAQSLDGKITNSSKYITNEISRNKVHEMRARYSAILTTTETVLKDNPILDCRLSQNDLKFLPSNPDIIVLGKRKIPKSFKLFQISNRKILFFNTLEDFLESEEIKKIDSIMTECGGIMNSKLLKRKLVENIFLFIAPMVIGKQEKNNFVSAVDLKDFVIHEVKNLEGDIFVEGKVVRVRTWGA